MTFYKQTLARLGEQIAKSYYLTQDYCFLSQNHRCLGSELDLIFLKQKILTIVEVKLRKESQKEILLEDLLPTKKKKALIKGALNFTSKNSLHYHTICFDLCLIKYTFSHLNHISIVSLRTYKDILY